MHKKLAHEKRARSVLLNIYDMHIAKLVILGHLKSKVGNVLRIHLIFQIHQCLNFKSKMKPYGSFK